MNITETARETWKDPVALLAGGVSSIGTTIAALTVQADAIFHVDEWKAANDEVDALQYDINSAQEAQVQFESADPQLKTDATRHLDEVIASKKEEIHAVQEQAPDYGIAQKVENGALGLGEAFAVWALVAVGAHKVLKSRANRKANKQA